METGSADEVIWMIGGSLSWHMARKDTRTNVPKIKHTRKIWSPGHRSTALWSEQGHILWVSVPFRIGFPCFYIRLFKQNGSGTVHRGGLSQGISEGLWSWFPGAVPGSTLSPCLSEPPEQCHGRWCIHSSVVRFMPPKSMSFSIALLIPLCSSLFFISQASCSVSWWQIEGLSHQLCPGSGIWLETQPDWEKITGLSLFAMCSEYIGNLQQCVQVLNHKTMRQWCVYAVLPQGRTDRSEAPACTQWRHGETQTPYTWGRGEEKYLNQRLAVYSVMWNILNVADRNIISRADKIPCSTPYISIWWAFKLRMSLQWGSGPL